MLFTDGNFGKDRRGNWEEVVKKWRGEGKYAKVNKYNLERRFFLTY